METTYVLILTALYYGDHTCDLILTTLYYRDHMCDLILTALYYGDHICSYTNRHTCSISMEITRVILY